MMGFTFGNFIIILIGIGLLVFCFFSVLAVINKNKNLSYVGIVFALVFLVFSLLSIVQHQIQNRSFTKDIPGTYKININKSDLKPFLDTLSNDTLKFNQLAIIFVPFNKFRLNMDVPFLKGNAGSWSYFSDGEIAYGVMKFTDGSKEQFDHNGKMLSIDYPQPKYGYKQVDLLYFDKIGLTEGIENPKLIKGKKGRTCKSILTYAY
jgi:hypothetical protein